MKKGSDISAITRKTGIAKNNRSLAGLRHLYSKVSVGNQSKKINGLNSSCGMNNKIYFPAIAAAPT